MMPLTQIIQNSSYVKQELSLTFRLFIKKKNNDICYLFFWCECIRYIIRITINKHFIVYISK